MNTIPPRPVALHPRSVAIVLLTLICMVLLAGCAGTSVVGGKTAVPQTRLAAPRSLAIVVADNSPLPRKVSRLERHIRESQTVQQDLANRLSLLFSHHGLQTIEGGDRHADLTLTCTITTVRGGSQAARLLVGYGAGKAVLNVTSTLAVNADPVRVLGLFSTPSTTGAMPGAGFGMMSAAGAAGTAIHMIGPVLSVPGTLRQGLAMETRNTADRIDEQVGKVFAAQGWHYPKV